MSKESWENLQQIARETLELDENWVLKSAAASITVGIEKLIESLENRDDLDNDERWDHLDIHHLPEARLPSGWLLVVLRHVDDRDLTKAGFVEENGKDLLGSHPQT